MSALRTLGQDLGYASRQIRRAPAVAAVVIASLGSAMAANTSLFAVFNEFFLRPWPVAAPDTVVTIQPAVTLAEWRDWVARTTAFSGLVAAGGGGRGVVGDRRVRYELVSAGYFEVLGIPLHLGRAFTEGEERIHGPGRAAIVSHRFWQEHLGGRPAAVGETIVLDGLPFSVAGVAPPTFDGVRGRVDLWLPFAAWPRLTAGSGEPDEPAVEVAGRLAPGASAEGARTELATVDATFRRDHGLDPVTVSVWPTTPYSRLAADERGPALLAILLTPTFLTLVACANVANLLLARGNARRGEIAVRLALGGSRTRLARQLLVEALLLAVLAGALGLAVASALPRYVLSDVPQLDQLRTLPLALDGRVFAWAFVVSVVAAVAFGLAPALQCTRLSVTQALQDAHGLSAPRLKVRLLGYQVTVSVVVLVLGALVARSTGMLGASDPGYSVERLALARLDLPRGCAPERRQALARRFFAELEAWAGPGQVAAASAEPWAGPWVVEVSRHYFDLLQIPIVAGRAFDATDPEDGVIVINEAAARRFLPSGYPVGHELGAEGWVFTGKVETREVIGIARDARLTREGRVEPVLFVPSQAAPDSVFFVGGPRASDPRAITAIATRLDSALYAEARTGPAWLSRATSGRRFLVKVLGGFGALALFLSTVGLFSVGAYGVQRRRREIGVRMALGARGRDVIRAVFWSAGRAIVRGALLGGLLAAGSAYTLRHFVGLNGLRPLDPATYAAVVLGLIAVAAVGLWLPARQALGTAPADVLRQQ